MEYWHRDYVAARRSSGVIYDVAAGRFDYIVHPYSNMDTLIIMNAVGDAILEAIDYADSLSWEYHVVERSKIPADWLHE